MFLGGNVNLAICEGHAGRKARTRRQKKTVGVATNPDGTYRIATRAFRSNRQKNRQKNRHMRGLASSAANVDCRQINALDKTQPERR
jgi:hypothetical protein